MWPQRASTDSSRTCQRNIITRERIGDRFVFQTEFVSSRWDEKSQTHTVTFRDLESGEPFEVVTDVIVSATGALNKPILPHVPDFDTFKGVQFHSSRWRTDVDLRSKRVAIVGNGSSGVQATANIVGLEGIQVTNLCVLRMLFLSTYSTHSKAHMAVSARLAISARRRTLCTRGGNASSSNTSRSL